MPPAMASITVSNLSKSYGGKKLFEDVDVTFTEGRRYGLTGPNGAGKSTFMKILAGAVEPDRGQVSIPKKTSVLKQDQSAHDEDIVLDTVMMGNPILWEALREKEALLAKGDALTDEDGMRLGELEGIIAEEDGYTAEADAAALLEGLGVPQKLHGKKMKELPGGLKVRALLAQALFGHPMALLLDEPTNNLDIDSINWLEAFLVDYDGILIVISHDRHFLNTVCTHIADIDYETIIVYTGGYDDMVRTKAEVRQRVERENAEKKKKIAQLNEFIQRFSAGSRASQVQSRKRALQKLKLNDLKRSNIQRPFIRFEITRKSGKQTLQLEGVHKRWPDLYPIEDFHALVTAGEKVAVIGRSGSGKSTLLKILAGELKADEGKVVWGPNTSIGYLPQEHRATIPDDTTVAEYLHSFDPKATNEEIRGLLGRMLFRGEEGEKPTHALSGGEAVRLIFSRLMLTKDNVLILDDPTNHLDLESIIALGDALERYEGTCFVATHDQDLIRSFATRLWVFSSQGLIDFPGTYDEYLEKFGGGERLIA